MSDEPFRNAPRRASSNVQKATSDSGWKVDPSSDGVHDPFDELLATIGDRITRGLPIDLEQYTAKFPEFGDRLRRAVASMQAVKGLGHDDVPSTASWTPVSGQLGDFLLFDEIGRGGMGTVYEAEQISLGRRVAVKILSSSAMLDPQLLTRFKNESRAAATLEHPHIVPIYAVGQERGVHYYAMKIVDGPSLADVIRDLKGASLSTAHASVASPTPLDEHAETQSRQFWRETRRIPPTTLASQRAGNIQEYFRTVARIGREAAAALDHAHAQGIVHRDIKPANLLLDEQGRTFVTDFGLARLENDVSLTVTGDFVGTLRYVSPEQASMKRGVTDHRTDIYSLGVTLFELLSLRPALDGDTRAELLRQLDSQLTPSLTAIDRRIPRDLERVIAKATEYQASDRYATAGEMAQDLDRFLTSRPVLARRPSWLLSVRRWIQRRPARAGLIGLLILLLMILATAGPTLAWRYNRLVQRESQARHESEATREKMQALLRDTVITSIEHLENNPDINTFHRQAMEQVLTQYEELLRTAPHDRTLIFDVGRAYARMGKVARLRFPYQRSHEFATRGLELLELLREERANDPAWLRELAEVQFWYACGKDEPAQYQIAFDSYTKLMAMEPKNVLHAIMRAVVREFHAATLIENGCLLDGQRMLEQSLAELGDIQLRKPNDLDAIGYEAWVRYALARLKCRQGLFDEANQAIQQAIALTNREMAQRDIGTRGRIASAAIDLTQGLIAYRQRRFAECEMACESAIRSMTDLLRGFPDTNWSQEVFIDAMLLRADCRCEMKRWSEAENDYRVTLERVATWSSIAERERMEIGARLRLGELLWSVNQPVAARQQFALVASFSEVESESTEDMLVTFYLHCPDRMWRNEQRAYDLALDRMNPQNGVSLRQLGLCQLAIGKYEHALQSLQAALLRTRGQDAALYFDLASVMAGLKNMDTAAYWYQLGLDHENDPSIWSVAQVAASREQANAMMARVEARPVPRLHSQ